MHPFDSKSPSRTFPARLLHWTSILCLALCCQAAHAVEPQVVSFSVARVSAPTLDASGYQVVAPITFPDGSVEYRCFFRGQHFLSLRHPDLHLKEAEQGGKWVRPSKKIAG